MSLLNITDTDILGCVVRFKRLIVTTYQSLFQQLIFGANGKLLDLKNLGCAFFFFFSVSNEYILY